jgi:hypothetical protein
MKEYEYFVLDEKKIVLMKAKMQVAVLKTWDIIYDSADNDLGIERNAKFGTNPEHDEVEYYLTNTATSPYEIMNSYDLNSIERAIARAGWKKIGNKVSKIKLRIVFTDDEIEAGGWAGTLGGKKVI